MMDTRLILNNFITLKSHHEMAIHINMKTTVILQLLNTTFNLKNSLNFEGVFIFHESIIVVEPLLLMQS